MQFSTGASTSRSDIYWPNTKAYMCLYTAGFIHNNVPYSLVHLCLYWWSEVLYRCILPVEATGTRAFDQGCFPCENTDCKKKNCSLVMVPFNRLIEVGEKTLLPQTSQQLAGELTQHAFWMSPCVIRTFSKWHFHFFGFISVLTTHTHHGDNVGSSE